MKTTSRIYCDYAAATPLRAEVLGVMQPWLSSVSAADFANASATHSDGQHARRAIDDARRSAAAVLNVHWNEVVFMSSGTESANTAVLGVARAYKQHHGTPAHIITTAIEHHAVLDACAQLEKEGHSVTVVPVNTNGIVSADDIAAAVQDNTALVSVMLANNEIGTLQPVAQIAEAVKAKNLKTLVHTDACQAGNYLKLDVQELGVDLLTLNGTKIYGPKGSALLYMRAGIQVQPLTFGGGQEFAMRPGTENVAVITGLSKALELAQDETARTQESARLTVLRDQFISGITAAIPGAALNGDAEQRLPNNANIFFPNIDGDIFLFELDQAGISASLGSACTAGSIDPSHVVTALGLSPEDARRSIRFTFGAQTTEQDINQLITTITEIINKK